MTIHEGQIAPDFTLPTETGAPVTLASFIGKSPVVLYFYPKDMTPGCTQESCDFRDAFPRFTSSGAVIFGISRDSIESHVTFKETYKLPFSLLADVDGKVCEAYGVWQEKSMYGKKYMGIDRTTVVIGKDGIIVRIFEKVKVTGHVAEVEAVLTGKAPSAAVATVATPAKKKPTQAARKTMKPKKKAGTKSKGAKTAKSAKSAKKKTAPKKALKTRKMPKSLKAAKGKKAGAKKIIKKSAKRSARSRSARA